MSYASSCIATLDYLLRKHDKLLTDALKLPDTLKAVNTRDHGRVIPLTVEEHDRIFARCHSTKLSNYAIASEVGRSFTVVSKVRRGKHKLYDPVRCEALYPAS